MADKPSTHRDSSFNARNPGFAKLYHSTLRMQIGSDGSTSVSPSKNQKMPSAITSDTTCAQKTGKVVSVTGAPTHSLTTSAIKDRTNRVRFLMLCVLGMPNRCLLQVLWGSVFLKQNFTENTVFAINIGKL